MNDDCYVEPIHKTTPGHVIQNADRILLSISGMGCQNCAMRVRNSLLSLDGVHDAEILLNMRMAEIYFDEKRVSTDMLVEAVAEAGNDGRHRYLAEVVAK